MITRIPLLLLDSFDLDRLRALFRQSLIFSDWYLKGVFVDGRLYTWRYRVPDIEDDPELLINELIEMLSDCYDVEYNNGLVLFLRVLCESPYLASDSELLRGELAQLADDLESRIGVN